MPSYLDHFADYEEDQLDLFIPPKLRAVDMPLAEGASVRDYGLRYYQEDCKEAIEVELATVNSTMVVMGTGLGKTTVFSAVAADWEGDVLIGAHRDELVQQAKHRLELMTGEEVDVEQGQLKSDTRSRIVVASLQSLTPARLARLGKDRFSLVIFDEFHHALARTYRRAWEYFNAKKLGVTATPDRSDEKALGRIVESVAYVMDIDSGIDSGYLVPLRARTVALGEIDISGVGTSGGDLIAAQLDEAMLKAVEGIVTKTLELEPGRQGIAFFPGVKSAELAAQRFNALKPHSAAFISGETDPDERRRIVKEFKDGRIQYLANCQIACLDSETEILTRQGWVGHGTITPEHEIANWLDGEITFSKPLAIEVRRRRPDEEMVTLQTPRISMRVTADHRVAFRTYRHAPWVEMRAHEVVGMSGELPVSGYCLSENQLIQPPPTKTRRIAANAYVLRKKGLSASAALAEAQQRAVRRDALRYTQPMELSASDCFLIGYWLGDGSTTRLKRGGLEFVLHNESSLDIANEYIERQLRASDLHFLRKQKNSVVQWHIPRGTGFGSQARRGLYRLEPYLKKNGTDLYWSLQCSQFEWLLKGLWMADGNHGDLTEPRSGAYTVSNTNREMMDLIQAIAVCRGFRCSLKWRDNGPRNKPLGFLCASKRTSHAMTRYRPEFEVEWLDEVVWCVKSQTSWIVARRKGNVFITGNTEGFDAPATGVIIQGRPTKSRSLYSQMVGRGTRPVCDRLAGLPGAALSMARRDAIRDSVKPDCMVLDFVGNTGKHSLVGPVDILGGNYTEDEVKEAKKNIAKLGGDPRAALEAARAELRRIAAQVKSKVTATVSQEFDPFSMFGIDRSRMEERELRFGRAPITEKQWALLQKKGVDPKDLEAMSKQQANKLISTVFLRQKKGLATFNQMRALARRGVIVPKNLSFIKAGQILDYKGGDPAHIEAIINARRAT